jgi:hypothetical protein
VLDKAAATRLVKAWLVSGLRASEAACAARPSKPPPLPPPLPAPPPPVARRPPSALPWSPPLASRS